MDLDKNLLQFFINIRTEEISFFVLIITYFGSITTTFTVTTLSCLSFYIHKEKKEIHRLLISVLGSTFTVFIIKILIERPRPLEALYIESTPAFPSAHAAIAMSLYGFLLWHVHKQKKQRFKALLITTLAILIILLGTSRLYLGVHYLSDVLAGYFVGFMWLLASLGYSKSKI